MQYLYYIHPRNVDQLFPQRHPLNPDVKIVYVRGERYYVSRTTNAVVSAESLITPAVPVPGPQCSDAEMVHQHHEPDYKSSPRSVTSSSAGGGLSGGACSGSRAIGKRNQQFYLPDGCVKLTHISVDSVSASASASAIAASTHHSKINPNDASGEHAHAHKWYGRYDKEKNTIMRTTTDYELPESVDIMEYETLSHFAQEHDKECWGNDYVPSNTHNVWKNPYFLYFNTVTLEWEPLNKLR
jgi:hypothetical protein